MRAGRTRAPAAVAVIIRRKIGTGIEIIRIEIGIEIETRIMKGGGKKEKNAGGKKRRGRRKRS